MTSSVTTSMAATLREAGRCLLSVVLIFAVSGGLSMVAQGVAWIQMAEESGGLQRLGEVIFKSEPCERCYAAARLNDESRKNNDGQVPAEAITTLRFSATLMDRLPLPSLLMSDCLKSFPMVRSDGALASLAYPPPLPPPRCASVA